MKALLINPPRENEIIGNNPPIIEKERGFNPRGIGGEYLFTKDYKTIIVILGRYDSIEIYEYGRLQAAMPINSIYNVDEICYQHGIFYNIPEDER